MKPRTVSRLVIGSIIFAAIAVGAWTSFAPKSTASGPQPILFTPMSPLERAPNFTLRNQNGHEVSLRSQRGHEVILTFMYTHCKDTCPLTTQKFRTVLRRFGGEGKRIRVVIVSTDPFGDTPATARQFLRRNGEISWEYLLGSYAQLAHVWKSYYETVNVRRGLRPTHDAVSYLINGSGMEQGILEDAATMPAIALDLHLVMHDKVWLRSLPVAPVVGSRIPNFVLPSLNGGDVHLAGFVGRRPLIVNFWASTCGPCRREMPFLARAYRRYAGRVNFIGVDEQEPNSAVASEVKHAGTGYPIALDRQGNVFYGYDLVGTPDTLIVTRSGIIGAIKIGAISASWLNREIRLDLQIG